MTNQTHNTSPQTKAGLLAEIARNVQLVWRLLKDSRVSTWAKLAIPGLAALYLLWPVDLLPDVLPVLGQMDDLALLALAVKLFIDLCPPDLVRQHRDDLAGKPSTPAQTARDSDQVVDAEYRVVE